MRKILLFSILVIGLVWAYQAHAHAEHNGHENSATPTQAVEEAVGALPELPNPGLTPTSPFYFLDSWGEAIGEFFTFNAEAKAALQAKRALERVAEVKAMLAEKEVSPRGLDVALDKLQKHQKRAADIILSEKNKGRKVAALAKKLDTDFELREHLLDKVMEEKEEALEAAFEEREFALEQKLLSAKAAGNKEEAAQVVAALAVLEQEEEAQEEMLEQKKEALEKKQEAHEKRLELALDKVERVMEEKEKEMEEEFEKRKEELRSHLAETKQAFRERRDALHEQLDEALSAGEAEEVEAIKEKFAQLRKERASVDEALAAPKQGLEIARKNIELFIAKRERKLENLEALQDFALEKAERALETAIEKKKNALEQRFEEKERALDARKSALKLKIAAAFAACAEEAEPLLCQEEKVSPLREQLLRLEQEEDKLEILQEKQEEQLEVVEEKTERALELREKALETKREVLEKVLEFKEEQLEKFEELNEEAGDKEETEESAEEGEEDFERTKDYNTTRSIRKR